MSAKTLLVAICLILGRIDGKKLDKIQLNRAIIFINCIYSGFLVRIGRMELWLDGSG